MSEQVAQVVFTALGLATQAGLVAYFAARRWFPGPAEHYGWLIYAMGLPSLLVGVAFLIFGWFQLAVGPLLFAAWTALGYQVDLRRPVNWRAPTRWSILIPYVTLLWIGIFGLWMPLRDVSLVYMALFGIMLLVHTTLNVAGHFGKHGGVQERGRGPSDGPAAERRARST